jgi:hypothetical protein
MKLHHPLVPWLRSSVIVVSLLSYGCVSAGPLAQSPCRDPATGRFVSCGSGSGSGSGSGDGWVAVGITLGALALTGLGYLIYSAANAPAAPPPPPSEAPAPQTLVSAGCQLPAVTATVCDAEAGYRFALQGPCPPRSTFVRTIGLDCGAVRSPAYHACVRPDGAWRTVPSWQICESGYTQADGAWVQPGNSPGAALTAGHGEPSPPPTTATTGAGAVQLEPTAPSETPPIRAPSRYETSPSYGGQTTDEATSTGYGATGYTGGTYVRGYYRRNGTYVRGYTRSSSGYSGGWRGGRRR